MKKTIYTCDFCLNEFFENKLTLIDEWDICRGCLINITTTIIKSPKLFEPYITLTPFCKKCNGTKKLFERNFNGVETCEEQLVCDACTTI